MVYLDGGDEPADHGVQWVEHGLPDGGGRLLLPTLPATPRLVHTEIHYSSFVQKSF